MPIHDHQSAAVRMPRDATELQHNLLHSYCTVDTCMPGLRSLTAPALIILCDPGSLKVTRGVINLFGAPKGPAWHTPLGL